MSGNVSDRFELNILEINLKSTCFDLKSESNEVKEKINSAYSLVFEFIDEMYDITINSQKDEISAVACASLINSKKGEILAQINELNKIDSLKDNENVIGIENTLIECSICLEKMVNELLTNAEKFSTILKYNFSEYVSIFV